MEKMITSLPEPKTETEYETALDFLLLELRGHQQRMDADRLEIELLKAETRAVGTHTDAVLASIARRLDGLEKAV